MTPAPVDGLLMLAVLATLASMMMIGLGFLFRPSTASLLWSIMFIVVMLSTFGLLIAQSTEMPRLAGMAAGLGLGSPAFAWSGLRASRGARAYAWVGPAIAVGSAIALGASVASPAAPLVYASAYLLGAVWAALTVYELWLRPERGGGQLIPLTIVSGLLPILAVAGMSVVIVEATLGPVEHVIPDLTSIGAVAYLVCAVVTLLPLARNPSGSVEASDGDLFSRTATDRLARAAAAGEQSWSLLAVSLDDTDALRVAGGEDAFRRVVERFADDVRACFPADADVGADGPSGFLVLVSRPGATVRECVRELLDRVTTISVEHALSVELAASAGWADVRSSGYDLDDLIDAAHRAMEAARSAGGHRWQRASATT
ncbi:diguanylate cyclase domain-containing protein [Agromyces sp. Marseille-P2726]|uniref:diguanylate cyclase domain-containing protein n=1 Tax=Agromyces sp. Marseille-P2726 TaxID=2709132 RepID=UPI00156EE169|nr:diguanylate cyclase [Agromyces sp. Marseille-P2726]